MRNYGIYVDGKFNRTESGRYFQFRAAQGDWAANLCNSSRKDFRDAVTAARGAFAKWSSAAPAARGQLLYQVAEALEGRKAQLSEELQHQGLTAAAAEAEVQASVNRLIYYAGWADKFQQVFSSVNPVASSHYNFSVLEPVGVVSILAPEESPLVGLVSAIAPVIVGGNSCVVLASSSRPLCAVTLGEVLQSAGLPAGVVNILTGFRSELLGQFTSHMDVNGVLYCGEAAEELKTVRENAALNVKRVSHSPRADSSAEEAQGPYAILSFQEVKTTWHPIAT
ncbi:MAG: aldehyde dehydrogenase family protein [Oligoflexia bacterium]|nr:aldehyde dehydrogenase family protein [Oligoflexia bacterium]